MIRPDITLRPHFVAGDLGWVVATHGEIYDREHGWAPSFEAKVAFEVGAATRAWDGSKCAVRIGCIGERRVGSIFVVPRDEATAQLRFLVVDPAARGTGLGSRLIGEAVGFARAAGYRDMILFTMASLTVARGLYARAGFAIATQERIHAHGRDLVEESWTLSLR